MALLVVVLAVGIIALPGLLGFLGRRLAPKEWSYLSAAAVAGGLVLVEIGLLLVALPMILRIFGLPALADACERLLGPVLVGGPAAGWVAAVAAVVLAVAAWRSVARARALRRRLEEEVWLGDRDRIGTTDIVVLPLGVPFAVALDGAEPCIVVSRELRAVLTGEQLDAVVRHEAAHLAAHHGRLLLLAAVLQDSLAWLLPPLRASAVALRLAVERWADEQAAAGSSETRAALRSALVGVAHARTAFPLPGLTDADAVIARIDALDRSPCRPRLAAHLATYMPGFLLGVGAAGALGTWASHAHMLASMAGRCPA